MRIGGNRGLCVTRHVDLGHNIYMTLGRIAHDIAHLVLSVKSAMRLTVIEIHTVCEQRVRWVTHHLTYHCLRSKGPDGREQRILRNLQSPALVVVEVQMQGVKLMQRHRVDKTQNGVDRHVPSGNVEKRPAPRKAGGVFDIEARNQDMAAYHFSRE